MAAHIITYHDIAVQVAESLCDHVDDFDIDGIVRDIVDRYGLMSIDTIDDIEYWGLVEKHAR